MQRWIRSPWKLPALSGSLLGLAYYAPLLVPNLLALVPLLYWLDEHPDRGAYGRLRAGLLLGLLTHLITLHFMIAMVEFSWLAILLYLGTALALAARMALIVALLGWLRRRTGLSWGLLLPLGWVPFEWLQTFGDLRFTGDQLAHTLSGYPFLVQFADLVGPYGVGAFMLCVNALVYESLLRRDRQRRGRAALGLTVLLVLVLGYDLQAWTRDELSGPELRVALVQPNIPQSVKLDPQTHALQWAALEQLTHEAAAQQPDLIVWPETARPAPLYHWLDRPETYAIADVQRLARQLGTPILTGVEYARVNSGEDYELYNAAMLVDGEGQLSASWSAKVFLVPFVEALPFRPLFGRFLEGRGGEWRWITGGFSPGPRDAPIAIDGARAGVLVCYEQLFGDLARGLRNAGADLQIVITNDAWFGRTIFQRFQADALRLRAIENRSAFLRVANTGISGLVDSRGRLQQATPLFERAVRVFDIPLAGKRTVFDRVGNVVAWLACVGLLCLVGLALRNGRS